MGQRRTELDPGQRRGWYEPDTLIGTKILVGGMGESIQNLVQKLVNLKESRIGGIQDEGSIQSR